MKKYEISLNSFSNGAAEALWCYGKYMEQESNRNSNSYFWARLSHWYLWEIGIPGLPQRAPTTSEMAGLRKIPKLRRTTRTFVWNQKNAGQNMHDLAFMQKVREKFVKDLKNDSDMVAALGFLKEQLKTTSLEVAVITPTYNQLYQLGVDHIDNRTLAQRCQSITEVAQYLESRQPKKRQAEAKPENVYDVVRINDILNEYESTESALEGPTRVDHVYGPAPVLEGV